MSMPGISGPVDPITRIFMKTEITDTCWLWKGRTSHGHGVFDYKKKPTFVHRFLWETFFGPLKQDECCCHKCDVRNCINPAHIFIGTREDNQRDMKTKGRSARGERNGAVKLTADAVLNIRKLYDSGVFQRDIAKKFCVSQSCVSDIIRKRRWAHIGE